VPAFSAPTQMNVGRAMTVARRAYRMSRRGTHYKTFGVQR